MYFSFLFKISIITIQSPSPPPFQVPTGSDEMVDHMTRMVAFPRETFWGSIFDVKSVPDPTNLSMTGAHLHCHTDFSWSETPPGLQLLLCRRFRQAGGAPLPPANDTSVAAGESIMVDGVAAAERLRTTNPDAFDLLASVRIPFVFRAEDQHYRIKAPVIAVDPDGTVSAVRFNQANRGTLDVAPPLVGPMYRALDAFVSIVRDRESEVRFRLEEGDLLTFNNRRLLHGRTSYDVSAVERMLSGAYVDWEEYTSCMRVAGLAE